MLVPLFRIKVLSVANVVERAIPATAAVEPPQKLPKIRTQLTPPSVLWHRPLAALQYQLVLDKIAKLLATPMGALIRPIWLKVFPLSILRLTAPLEPLDETNSLALLVPAYTIDVIAVPVAPL